ncbi:MAG: universal stress protein [Lewinellaceae bacterium]|nr:universal stress protein [Lewinellaceae bacterium]
MVNFARVLVALDMSGMDQHLLELIGQLSANEMFEKIYFLHVTPDFTVPTNIDAEFHKLFSQDYPVDERLRDKIALDVTEVIGELPGVDVSVEVREGNPYKKLMHWLEVKEVDLLVVGHKAKSEGSGITARRVARHAPCNILLVPPQSSAPKSILVPIDFSAASARALRTAIDLRKENPGLTIRALYIVDQPPTDYYMRPFEDSGFRGLLREAAAKSFNTFCEREKLSQDAFSFDLVDNVYSSVALHINEYAEAQNVDWIVLGAQGHSALESFVFGSVTEKLVEHNTKQVILIVR